jgi:hypothetical protein
MSSSDIRDILQIGPPSEPTQRKPKQNVEKRPGIMASCWTMYQATNSLDKLH